MNFKRDDGVTPLRSFDDVNHMNEYMVMQHNRVVGLRDKVYFLGDVTIAKNADGLKILDRMNGEKVLIRGNHDLCKLSMYLPYFKDVRGVARLDGMVMSHIPLHPESLSRWGVNVHGHLHHRVVKMMDSEMPDPRYYNVSMERLDDYTPISLEELKKVANIG
jgi:calcineurin-like phosphoesterase family protein